VLVGKLGFEGTSERQRFVYDQNKHDFEEALTPVEQGNFVLYTLDVGTQIVAFEERLPDIPRDTFVRMMTRFLDMAGTSFEINLISDDTTFAAWLERVNVVTSFRAEVQRPNPTSDAHTREVRRIIDEIAADSLQLDAARHISAEDTERGDAEGLKVGGTLLQSVADYASLGNGDFRTEGFEVVQGTARRRTFSSESRRLLEYLEIASTDSESDLVVKLVDLVRRVAGRLGAGNHSADE
jgi:hypothetical protein